MFKLKDFYIAIDKRSTKLRNKTGSVVVRILFANTYYQKRVEYTSLISVVPPLDLAYCVATVRERMPAAETALFDANVLGLSEDKQVNRIEKFQPDLVVLTAATHSINAVAGLAKRIAREGRFLALIGSHGTALPERTLTEIPELHAIVRGEPEQTTAELAELLAAKAPLRNIAGLAFRENENIVLTSERPQLEDLDTLPFPARDLLPNRKYSSPFGGRVTALITTRGCPGGCRFCDGRLLNGCRTRTRRPVRVVDEIAECVKHKISYFAILDHSFTASRAFVASFCEELIVRLGGKIRWVCNTRVDMLDNHLLGLMRRAGCLQIGIGMESADDQRLTAIGKGVTEKQIAEAIGRIKKHGMIAMGYAIIGFPTDDAAAIARTRDKIMAMDPHTLQLSFATPLPGTDLYKQCLRENRILSDNWNDYVFLRKSIIRNDTLSSDELVALRRRIVRRFYFRPGKFIRLSWFLLFRAKIDLFAAARAFGKILFNLGKS